jgi:hypothetical protein
VLNPVDLACIVGAATVAAPPIIVAVQGEDAQPTLKRVRNWIAGNTGLLNALLILVVGVLQVIKGLQQI